MREPERMRELGSEEKEDERKVFVEKKKGERNGENEEEKKWLVTVRENEKARTHLMAKLRLRVVLASPLNYV